MFKFDPSLHRINPFCVYTLEEESVSTQWIGICKFASLLNVPDAKRNPLFDVVFPAGNNMHLTILAHFSKRHEAQNFYFKWLRENPKPFMMVAGWSTINQQQFVKCVETQEVFPSITEVAKRFNVSRPYISKHLRGDPGCSKVQGQYSFKWTTDALTTAT